MKYSSFLALRYLYATRENSFFSWVSALSILGIAIGVAAMIVVLSVINGFETELRERFLAANAHVLVYRYPNGMRDYPRWADDIRAKFNDEITGVSAFVYGDTMAKKDHILYGVLIRGILPIEREKVQSLKNLVRPISSLELLEKDQLSTAEDPPEGAPIILGSGLMRSLRGNLGDHVELICPSEDSDNPLDKTKKFKIVGIYDSGLQHYDTKLGIVSLRSSQKVFNFGDRVTGLEIGLVKPNESVEIAERIYQEVQVPVKEWQSFNKGILESLKNERTLIGFIVALVAFVASFNIFTTLFVSVTLKQRDVSILRALGATKFQILLIFLKQSLFMGTIGGFLGMVLAAILAYILKYYPFIDLPDIYLLASLPVNWDINVYMGVGFFSVLIALIAGIYPAYVAASILPTLGLTQVQN